MKTGSLFLLDQEEVCETRGRERRISHSWTDMRRGHLRPLHPALARQRLHCQTSRTAMSTRKKSRGVCE